jgi:hypothetical protein
LLSTALSTRAAEFFGLVVPGSCARWIDGDVIDGRV